MDLISQRQIQRVYLTMQVLMTIDYGLIIYLSSNNFRPERGLYFFSSFRYTRHNEYIGPWAAVMQEISMSEMHMYHAEALAQTGNLAGAAAILNDAAGAKKEYAVVYLMLLLMLLQFMLLYIMREWLNNFLTVLVTNGLT